MIIIEMVDGFLYFCFFFLIICVWCVCAYVRYKRISFNSTKKYIADTKKNVQHKKMFPILLSPLTLTFDFQAVSMDISWKWCWLEMYLYMCLDRQNYQHFVAES